MDVEIPDDYGITPLFDLLIEVDAPITVFSINTT